MAHFPLYIDISHRKCLVIGGGKVAARKVETLLSYGAEVLVISPQVCPELLAQRGEKDSASEDAGRLTLRMESLDPQQLVLDLEDAALLVAASGSREANHQAAEICHRLGVPVNVADDQSECTFFFPAVVKRGDISIGINTGGASPLVSSRIRGEIQQLIPGYYEDITDQLKELREGLKESIPEEKDRRRFLKEVARRAFEEGRPLTQEELT